MKKNRLFAVRGSEEDSELIDALQRKLRLASKGEVWRQGIYLLADKYKIKLKAPQKS